MTNERSRVEIDGALIRGADGGLYFIPSADLQAFRLPDDQAAPVLDAMDQQGDVQGYVLKPLQPGAGVQLLPALYGPFGWRDLLASPSAPTQTSLTALRLLDTR
jgi:hypothetical protein